ncbi:phosphate ABC transporter substrate-binding protein PstS [Humidisolicoccus flavus]|uniref:phosphate ABC transporter substrate-binding protein PstS n=1 Tax=Humidisolicoccus flavus TaxID=3111414 RepID=UPI00324A9F12
MKFTQIGRAAVIAVAGAVLLTSCAANEGTAPADSTSPSGSGDAALTGTLNGSGASSMGSAQEAWIAGFQGQNQGVTVNYEPGGSSVGREAFISGGVSFAGSDAFLSDEELAGEFAACAPDASAFDVPVYISPIAIIFNVDGVDSLNLDAATVGSIFKGDITSWDDPAIVEQNPDATLPSSSITAVHRADGSGTTENFTDWLAANAPEVWDAEVGDEFPYAGESAQGTSGVVDAVTNGVGTIGYADASRAGDLGTVAIQVGEEYVAFTPEAAAMAVAASPRVENRPEGDIAVALDRTLTEPGAYPLVLISYAIACTEYADAEAGKLVNAYLTYITSPEGQDVAAEAAGTAPLSEELQTEVAEIVGAIK